MARITVTVCDKCETQDGVDSYEIRQGVKKTKVDLCAVDAGPLTELITLAAPTPVRKAVATKKTTARKPRKATAKRVTTIEEIEAMKKK